MEKQDYLDVDKPIPGQSYVCMSFLSPEDMVEKKQMYVLERFREFYFARHAETVRAIAESLQDNAVLRDKFMRLQTDSLEECYEMFKTDDMPKHESEFDAQNNNRCSVRGLKIRGTYASLQEAENRAKKLQKKDPNFHVFVGPVGYWLPWDPSPDGVQDQVYAEERLNDLMHEYKKNLEHKNEVWERTTRARIEEARREGASGRSNADAEPTYIGAIDNA